MRKKLVKLLLEKLWWSNTSTALERRYSKTPFKDSEDYIFSHPDRPEPIQKFCYSWNVALNISGDGCFETSKTAKNAKASCQGNARRSRQWRLLQRQTILASSWTTHQTRNTPSWCFFEASSCGQSWQSETRCCQKNKNFQINIFGFPISPMFVCWQGFHSPDPCQFN